MTISAYGPATCIIETVEKAKDAIMDGFVWDKTPQGVEFWHRVHASLCELLEDAKARRDDEDKPKPEEIPF